MNTAAGTVTLPPLTDTHRAYLRDHAVTDEVIRSASIFSDGDHIVFPWVDREAGEATFQDRRWPPFEDEVVKYRWNRGIEGKRLHFGAWRVPAGTGPVIIAEGTKQSLAIASWAPAEYAVYGMSGCWGWRNRPENGGTRYHRLDRFAGRDVVVILDVDAAANLDVYEAGEKLAAELALEDAASVAFVRMPGVGKEGADDYLANIDPDRREERLAKLIASAQPAPAAKRPTARKITETQPETNGLPLLIVNTDRRTVIHTAIGVMQDRWGGRQLFNYGGAIARLRENRIEPLDRDSFANWLAESVAMYKYKPPGLASPGTYEATWPDPTTMGALLARGDEFPDLIRISQTPFIRRDGSVCAKNGYDEDTGTMLVMGNSGMDRLDIPDAPGQADAAVAASYLLDTWLGDYEWRDEASRANALALVLTPFIRGIVPLVPLAVVSGLQMGVGKNLLADCIAGLTTGTADVAPMPWIPDDDEENGKKIHAAFREGHTLMCFDEAHVIGGSSITRAVTAQTYQDRILGVSKMASYPNRVTWMALGNQVAVLADMARRAYFIEIYPTMPNPQDRDDSYFRIKDPREWTVASRPELVTAVLVMIRAWFAAGQPAHPRGTLMGSFEKWDKIMSGILGHAGVPGFLGNLAERRAERDTTGGFWGEHLAWLHDRLGNREFTTLDVKTAAMSSGGTWEAPPHLEDPAHIGFARDLGMAYARVQERWFGPYRIMRGDGAAHRKVAKWHIEHRGGSGGSGGTLQTPPDRPGIIPTDPVGGSGGSGGTVQVPSGNADVSGRPPVSGPPVSGHTLSHQGFPEVPPTGVSPAHPTSPGKTALVEGVEVLEGTLPPDSSRTHARTRAHAHTHVREGTGREGPYTTSGPSGVVLGFDLETADADDLFRWDPARTEGGAGFVRLPGVVGPHGVSQIVSVPDLLALIRAAARLDGHNIMGFDGLALAQHHGLDWHEFAAKARDSELIARQVNPPRSRESGTSVDRYDLDHVASELGVAGKTDQLSRLAKKHGGYHLIPLGDEEYRSYLMGDLAATRGVSDRLNPFYDADPYLPREHRLAALAGQMSLSGFAVDHELLARRREETEVRKRQALGLLHDGWGLPLDKGVMRGRGAARQEVRETLDSPLAGKAGRSWLEQMYEKYQIPDPPRTGKSHDLAIGADALREVTSRPDCPEEFRTMTRLMGIATGARTVYQTATDWLCPDGRVHPKISMRQASGRWSFLKPGLTVYGKHAGRHVEREVFTADPGEVLLSFDLSQVDMRAIAGHSQDPEYIKLFWPGRDAHTEIALRVFGDAKRRQDAKARGHGWNYGMGPERMIRDGVAPELAYGFDHGMKESFPVVCSWREQIRAIGRNGQILDNGFGRRMRCDPHWAYTVAPALMGQGGARDIMCECLLALPSWLWPMMRAMVHDEIIFSVPAGILPDVVRVVTAAMTWTWTPPGAALGVPILCDINGPGWSWGDISGKCPDCGKGAHGRGWCETAASLKAYAAKHEMELVS